MATPVGVLFQNPIVKPLSSNATFMSGCTATFYLTGTTTLTPVYADGALTTPLANPLTADFSGTFVAVYLDPAIVYRVIIKTSAGVLVSDTDPVIPSAISGITSTIVGRVLYPVTAAELSLSVTPTSFAYPADPYVDPRRYGADPLGVADSTTAVQTAINVAYASKGMVWIGPSCTFLCGALSLTMTGSATNPFRMVGSSVIGSTLLAKPGLAATSLLTFKSSNPTTVLIQAFLKLENFSIFSTAKTSGVHGLSILGLATWQISGVRISGFDRGLDIQSSLIGVIDRESEFVQNNYGANIQLSGAYFVGASTTNLIRIFNSRFLLNTSYGISYNNGSQFHVRNCSIEGNGTAGNLNTGGVRIQGALSPDSLTAGVLLDYNWFESNLGIGILVDAPTGGCSTNIAIRGGHILSQEAGRSLTVNGATRLLLEDIAFMDTANLTAGNVGIRNCLISTLNDAGVSTPNYEGYTTSAANFPRGRVDTALLTLTGVSGPVTQTVKIIQQGDEIRVVFDDLLGTSTSTSCTITGLPIKYSPGVTRFATATVEDNAIDLPQQVAVAAGGTITLFKAGLAAGFTAAGTKGLRACNLTWRL